MVLKKAEFDNPDKMKFESAHKTFNRQTNVISPGNVIATTQYSSYIRPYTEVVNPVGQQVAPGVLQTFDLRSFQDYRISHAILQEVRRLTHDVQGILYLFKHYTSDHHVMLDGLVLTTPEREHVKTWYLNSDWRAGSAVDEARRYIAHHEEK